MARVFILMADERLLAQRRLARARDGHRQTLTFLKAKATKIANIEAKYHPTVLPSNTMGEQANNLQRLVVMARSWAEVK